MKLKIVLAVLICLALVGSANAVTIIDDFEDGDIAEYGGDTGGYYVVSEYAYNGSYSLKINGSSFYSISSTSGLDNYPSQGDTFRYNFNMTDVSNGMVDFGFATQSEVSDLNGYYIRWCPFDSTFKIQYDSGPVLASTSITPEAGLWYEVNVSWESDGTITATLYHENGTQLAQISAVNTSYTSGGVGMDYNSDEATDKAYWDYVRLVGDDAPPTVSFEPDTTSAGTHDQHHTFANITASDDYQVQNTTIYLTNDTWSESHTGSTTPTQYDYNFTGLSYGDYTLKAWAYDNASQKSDNITRSITLSKVTVIDNFEDGDISEYGVNTSFFHIEDSVVWDGDYSLNATDTTLIQQLLSTTGFPAYPRQGSSFSFRTRFNDVSGGAIGIAFGLQNETYKADSYNCLVIPDTDEIRIRIWQDGTKTDLNTTSIDGSYKADVWYNLSVEWQTDGTIYAEVFHENGTKLGEVTAVNNTYTEGGVGYIYNNDEVTDVGYIDYVIGNNLSIPIQASFEPDTTSEGGHEQHYIFANATATATNSVQNTTIYLENDTWSNSYTDPDASVSHNWTGLSYSNYTLKTWAYDSSGEKSGNETRDITLGEAPNFTWDHTPSNGSTVYELHKFDTVDCGGKVEWTTDGWSTIHSESLNGYPVLQNPQVGSKGLTTFKMRCQKNEVYNETTYTAEYQIVKVYWGEFHHHTPVSHDYLGSATTIQEVLEADEQYYDWVAPGDHAEDYADPSNHITAVDNLYDPGNFTTFYAQEYSGWNDIDRFHLNLLWKNTSIVETSDADYDSDNYASIQNLLSAFDSNNEEYLLVTPHHILNTLSGGGVQNWTRVYDPNYYNQTLVQEYIRAGEIYSCWGTNIGNLTEGISTTGNKPFAHKAGDSHSDEQFMEYAMANASSDDMRIWFTGGTDWHDFNDVSDSSYYGDWFWYNDRYWSPSGLTGVFAKYNNRSNIWNGIYNGHTMVTDHMKIKALVKFNGEPVIGGETNLTEDELDITVRASTLRYNLSPDFNVHIFLIKNNKVVAESTSNKTIHEITYTDTDPQVNDFYYTVIWDEQNYLVQGSEDTNTTNERGWRAWTSPTYISNITTGVCGYSSGDWIVSSPLKCNLDVSVDSGSILKIESGGYLYGSATITTDTRYLWDGGRCDVDRIIYR